MFLFPLFLLTGFLLDFHDSQWKGNPSTFNLKLLQNMWIAWILQSDVDRRAVLCISSITLSLQNLFKDEFSPSPMPLPSLLSAELHT